ncbi:hypothetical protein GCM10009416_15930 [Craurococcus roseus]|uniref:Uncharacterized protein n=1 Tax=Craurococcus roseus TaxID=77585 RepID=A0ABP3Q219_9PROT
MRRLRRRSGEGVLKRSRSAGGKSYTARANARSASFVRKAREAPIAPAPPLPPGREQVRRAAEAASRYGARLTT